MKPIIETILEELRDPQKIADDDFEILAFAGEALAKFSMVNYNTAGICPEIDACEISAEDSKRIVEALLEYYKATTCNKSRSAIIYALSKARDPELTGFFREQLLDFTKLLLLANGAVFQTMIALDNLNEPILEGGGSIIDVETNLSEARKYLAQYGEILPW